MRFGAKVIIAIGLTLGSIAALALDTKIGNFRVLNAWIRPVPHGAKVAAGYVTIESEGGAADRLISASSPAADAVEFHEMSMDGDVMKMRALTGLDIPGTGKLALSPGGSHLMFLGLKAPFQKGDEISVTLNFEKAGSVAITMPVAISAADGSQSLH